MYRRYYEGMLHYDCTVFLHAGTEEELAIKVQALRRFVKAFGGEMSGESKERDGKKRGRKPSAMIAPETVAIVRQLHAKGIYTYRALCEELMRRGIKTPAGGTKWWPRQIEICLGKTREDR